MSTETTDKPKPGKKQRGPRRNFERIVREAISYCGVTAETLTRVAAIENLDPHMKASMQIQASIYAELKERLEGIKQ